MRHLQTQTTLFLGMHANKPGIEGIAGKWGEGHRRARKGLSLRPFSIDNDFRPS